MILEGSEAVNLTAAFAALPWAGALLAVDAPSFTVLAVTDAYCRDVGRSRDALLGRGFFETVADGADDADALRAAFAQVLRTGAACRPEAEGRAWALVTPVSGPDGAVRQLLLQAREAAHGIAPHGEREARYRTLAELSPGATWVHQDGRFVPAVQVIVRDVTERTRAERALRASEARYRALFESIDAGFCVIEVLFEAERVVDYRFVETNPAFERQTGLLQADGRTARDLVPGLEQHWFDAYGRVAATGEGTRFQSGSDAMGRWFDVYAFRVGAPEARRVGILFSDVTAAKLAERERERLVQALEVERARLQEVFRSAPSFIVAFRGPQHVYEFVNEAYHQLVGRRDLLGRPLHEALPEIREQGFEELLERVRRTGEPWVGRETPVRLRREPGLPLETRYLDMVLEPLAEADGTRAGVVVHGSDVTAQVLARHEVERLLGESERARAEAEAARAEAEAANRAKAEFLTIMSHELRTPLNAIGGYAELLELGIRGPVTDEQAEDLRRVQASQRHLLGLVNEVLNYARIETGTLRYALTDVPLPAVIASVEPLVAPQLGAKALDFAVASCEPAPVALADPEKVRQVLLNLLSNAVKFTDGPGGQVEVACETAGDRVLLHVRDTGIGIEAAELERIFEPFVQVNASLTRVHEGTGLGLAISRDLARGMGGDLTAQSTPGAGSTFTLSLPRA